MLATNSGICKTIWLLSKRQVSRSAAPAHTSLSSQEATLWPVSSSSLSSHTFSHLKMDVPWINQLSHHWSERGISKRKRRRDCFAGVGVQLGFHFLQPCLLCSHTSHWQTAGERAPPLSPPPFPCLTLPHSYREGVAGQSRSVAEVSLVLRDLRSWVTNVPSADALFPFETQFCKPKWGSCAKPLGERCGSLLISSLMEPMQSKKYSTAQICHNLSIHLWVHMCVVLGFSNMAALHMCIPVSVWT